MHLLPPKAGRVHLMRGFGYNTKTQWAARRLAITEAKELGHDMTRFGYLKEIEAVQSSCRKCRLKIQDFNFSIHGPALEYKCGPSQPVINLKPRKDGNRI